MPDLSQHKPGQRITSMSHARFMQLLQGLEDGTLKERWAEGKEPVTKKERTEAMQIRVMVYMYLYRREDFDLLSNSEDWYELEIIKGQGDVIHARAWEKRKKRR